MQIGEYSVLSAQLYSGRESRDTLNGMQKIPEAGPQPSADCISCSVGEPTKKNRKGRDTLCSAVDVEPDINKPPSGTGSDVLVRLSLGTLSCAMVGSAALGALAALVLLRP